MSKADNTQLYTVLLRLGMIPILYPQADSSIWCYAMNTRGFNDDGSIRNGLLCCTREKEHTGPHVDHFRFNSVMEPNPEPLHILIWDDDEPTYSPRRRKGG